MVLIGSPEIYQILVRYDPEFLDLFKISADFEDDVPRDAVDETTFAALIASLVRKHQVRHLDASGVARVYEHAMRLSSDRERLSLNLRLITNLLKEADHFAGEAGLETISKDPIHKAIQAQRYRSSRLYERLIEETGQGTLMIDVDGQCVGQVNGLSVYEFGNHFFGHPTRITAVVRMGDGHVIDIEREVKMGGPIHSKGVLILSGYLKSRFAVDVPLSISASLVFEQSYGEVEGDSASLAELACLLSALSQVPLKQGIAVTGSVNQLGVVQPVGAINEKIEGFFDLCRRKGLTGTQGVVIPGANLRHLMLRDDVVEAVQEKRFSVFAVETVDDCMHTLTGMEPNLVNDQVETCLRQFAKQSLKFRQDGVSAQR